MVTFLSLFFSFHSCLLNIDIPHFLALCFIVSPRCFNFKKWGQKPSTAKRVRITVLWYSLYIVVWNWTCNICKVCLYYSFIHSLNIKNILETCNVVNKTDISPVHKETTLISDLHLSCPTAFYYPQPQDAK